MHKSAGMCPALHSMNSSHDILHSQNAAESPRRIVTYCRSPAAVRHHTFCREPIRPNLHHEQSSMAIDIRRAFHGGGIARARTQGPGFRGGRRTRHFCWTISIAGNSLASQHLTTMDFGT
jgi:hypothetical protein